MWYRFEDFNPVGIPRIRKYQIAFYDMTRDGCCFDEMFCSPNEIDKVMPFVETIEDADSYERTKVFVHFDNGDIYELKMEKVN